MRKRFFSLVLTAVLIISNLVVLTGCDLSSLETKNSNMNNSDRYDGLTVLLNGHVEDENGTDDLMTPCAFFYDNKIGIIQTDFLNRIPNDMLGLYSLPSGKRYLVITFAFRNGNRSDINVSSWDFKVYANNVLCESEYVLDDEFPSSATVSSKRDAIIYAFFKVPIDADTIEIEYDSSLFADRLVFTVGENGRFTDADFEELEAAAERVQNGQPARVTSTPSPTPTIDPDAPVRITRSQADSFYHSNSANRDYNVDLTHDGDYSTSWQDGSEGDAVGETLTYRFVCADITRIEIVNGNRKDGNSYSRNNRLARAVLTFYLNGNQVYEEVMEFEDDASIVQTVLSLDEPVTCNSIVLTIEEVFPGSDYDDTGIAEVMFYTN